MLNSLRDISYKRTLAGNRKKVAHMLAAGFLPINAFIDIIVARLFCGCFGGSFS